MSRPKHQARPLLLAVLGALLLGSALGASCSFGGNGSGEIDADARPLWRLLDTEPVVDEQDLQSFGATVTTSRRPCDFGSGGEDVVSYLIDVPEGSASELVANLEARASEAGWESSGRSTADVAVYTRPVPDEPDGDLASLAIRRPQPSQVSVVFGHRGEGC